ncbi:MAG: hypothetical protein ABII82_00620 [Verrucomicrobiota bacterium]
MPPSPFDSSDLKKIDDGKRSRKLSRWRWLFPLMLQRSSNGTHLVILWKRLLPAILLWALGLWIGGATALFLNIKYRRGFDAVRYTDMLFLPVRWDDYQTARGDFYIETAKQNLKDGKFREAFSGLRAGIAKSPGNREGRMLLAQFFMLWKRPDLAQELLVNGLEQVRPDREYLQTLFTFLIQQQQDAKTLTITEALLRQMDADDESRPLVAMAKATAAFYRGNYDLAEDTLAENNLSAMRDARILFARIDWERGLRDQALQKLRDLSEQAPDDQDIYAQLISYLREDGRDSEIQQISLLRQIAHPDQPRPRIDYLYILDKQKDEERTQNLIEEIFRDFPESSEAMLALADFAANTGRPKLARRIYDYTKANDLNWEGPALMTVEAHVVAKQFSAAIETSRQMLADNPEWGKRFASVFNGLQAIANYGLGDAQAAQIFLNNFLTQSNIRADNLVAVSNRLVAVGAKEQARQVLAQAIAADPLNQPALVGLIKLDLELRNPDALAENVAKLLDMRKPPRQVLRDAYYQLSSDRYLFASGRGQLLATLREALNPGATARSS